MKIIQLLTDDIPMPIKTQYEACVSQVVDKRPKDVSHVIYHQNPFPGLQNLINDYRYQTDLIRLKLACENPDMLWLDADCEIKKWWEPQNDKKPYFFYLGNAQIDLCAFYVNGNIEFFKKMMDKYDQNPSKYTINWPHGMINCATSRSAYGIIPVGTFIHKGLSRLRQDIKY